jgi:predicted RNA-binding Zn-ribbon protein involved in translation (DUF1610 family)
MKVGIKQHGYVWFFRGVGDELARNSDQEYPDCPECDNDGLNDDDELTSIDIGMPKKLTGGKYTTEFKCLKCGYHAVYERTEKEIEKANDDYYEGEE